MNENLNVEYEFGDFQLLPRQRQLRRGGAVVALTPKAFETLSALVTRRGQLVTKDDLMQIVWGDVIVEEIGLTRNISVLRKILDDDNPKNPQFIETVSRFGYRFVAEVRENSAPDADQTSQALSLAVLPLNVANLEEADKYLGVGLADAVITRLSGVRRIVVRPTGSILKFAENERDPFAVGAELQVDFVLDGLLIRTENRLRVTVQAIDVRRKEIKFGEKFEGSFDEIAALQNLIAEQIAGKLLQTLTLRELETFAVGHSPPAAAYQAYLRGRFLLAKKTPQNLWEAFEQFMTATALDPNFALAFCGLADVYAHLQLRMSLASDSEHITKARNWLNKALELDPNIAEAHATLGYFAYFYEWNWQQAEREFIRSIEINPNLAVTYELYANFLSRQKRHEEAHEQIENAISLDSSSFQSLWLKAQIFYRERNFAAAWQITEMLIAEYADEPKLYHVYLLLGASLSLRQRFDESFAALAAAESLSMRSFDGAKELISAFGAVHARAGNMDEAAKYLDKLEKISVENDVSYELATLHANLGNFEKAFELLFALADKRDWRLIHLNAELDFFVLQDDPRFQLLIEKINL